MISMNYPAIVVAALAGIAIGFVWFMDPVFGRTWKKLVGIRDNDKPHPAVFVIWAGACFLMAYTVNRVLTLRLTGFSMDEAILYALMLGLGIFVAGALPNYAFAKKPPMQVFIEMGNVVLSLMVMAAIIAAW